MSSAEIGIEIWSSNPRRKKCYRAMVQSVQSQSRAIQKEIFIHSSPEGIRTWTMAWCAIYNPCWKWKSWRSPNLLSKYL